MKVLLVEDDDFKRKQIGRFISDCFDGLQLIGVGSVKAAESALFKEEFELVLIDMSLPTFEVNPAESGGRPQGFGGREILEFMDFCRSKAAAVVITQFKRFNEGAAVVELDDLTRNLMSRHSDRLIDVIFFEAGSNEWQQRLASALEKVRERND